MSPGVLKNPKGEDRPLLINESLALVAWKVTGKLGVAGVIGNKFIHFDVL